MQDAPVMPRSVGAGAMIAAAVALAILLAMLMFAQTADFADVFGLKVQDYNFLRARPVLSRNGKLNLQPQTTRSPGLRWPPLVSGNWCKPPILWPSFGSSEAYSMAPTAALAAAPRHARKAMLALCLVCLAALAPVPVHCGQWRKGPTYGPIASVDGVKYGFVTKVISMDGSGTFIRA